MITRESIFKRYVPANDVHEPKVDCNSYWFVFSGNKLLVTSNGNNFNIPFLKSIEELDIVPIRTQYLGILEGQPSYSAEVSLQEKNPEGMCFTDLRGLYETLEEDIFLLAGRALQIVAWDQTHQFCGRCGSATETQKGERSKICPKCGFISYPRISPAVIAAVLKGDKILLAHNGSFPGNMHSAIAGFLEPGETLEECVAREIVEEVGIKVKNIKYFGSQPWPFPNSMMIAFIAEYESGEIVVDGKEITEAAWFGVENLPELPNKMSVARVLIEWYIDNYS